MGYLFFGARSSIGTNSSTGTGSTTGTDSKLESAPVPAHLDCGTDSGIGSRKIRIITALVAALATRRVMISSWGLIRDVYSQYPLQIKKLVSIINSLKLRA